jgi:phosphoribosyl-ATP pyrophosphohydrolase
MTDAPERHDHVLDTLHRVIESRHGGDPDGSYTAKLFAAGPEKIAKKLGEEAVETVIAGVGSDDDALAAESADLLYHLLVLWSARGLDPQQVWTQLEARLGTSGLAEKQARKKQA